MAEGKFAPKEVFDQILEWSVIPTFDLVIEYEGAIVLVKRKLAPYKDQWALPGLRMLKGESIDDTLVRIAQNELSLKVDTSTKVFLGQYVGRFKTEHNRQDLSTGYCLKAGNGQFAWINQSHFYGMRSISSKTQIPSHTGAMYRFYLDAYFGLKESSDRK